MEELKKKGIEFIRENYFCSLATICPDGTPHVADMFLGVDDNLILYFATKTETRKFKNLLENPNVALSVMDIPTSRTMQIKGMASKIENAEEAVKSVHMLSEIINQKTPFWPPPLAKLKSGHFIMFKVEPTWMRLADYQSGGDAEFHQIV